jgi:DNA-binding transcriptional LysR family regulator
MTQPGVSHHISQLEAQTGAKLLVREGGKFKVTKEGRVIFKYAEKIETAARDLENRMKAMKKGEKSVLRIATTPVYSRIMMPFLLGTFQNANPDILIKFDSGNSNDMIKTITTMENDVVIVASQKTSKKLFSFPLINEELVLITANGHPLSQKESVSLSEIAGYPLIIREEGSATRKVVLSAYKSLNIKPVALIDMRSTEFIKQWVSQGTGVSLLIKRAVLEDERKRLKVIPLKENLSLEVSVLYLKSRKYDKSIQRFLNHVRELKEKSILQ